MSNLAFCVNRDSFIKEFLTPISRLGDGVVNVDIVDGEVRALLAHSNQTSVLYTRHKAINIGTIATIAWRNTAKIIRACQFVNIPEPCFTVEDNRYLAFKSSEAAIHIPLVPQQIAAQSQCGLKPERIETCPFDVQGILTRDAISNIIRAQQATDGKTVELYPQEDGIYASITDRDVPGSDKIALRILNQTDLISGRWTKNVLLPTDTFATLAHHQCDIETTLDQNSGRFIFMARTANTTTKYAQLALADKKH